MYVQCGGSIGHTLLYAGTHTMLCGLGLPHVLRQFSIYMPAKLGFSASLYTSMHIHGHANMHTDVLVDFFEPSYGNIEDSPIEVMLTLSGPIATDLDVRIRMMNLTQVFELTEGEVARRLIHLPDNFPDPGVFDQRRPYIASSECTELMIVMA